MNTNILFVMKFLDNPSQFTGDQAITNRDDADEIANAAHAVAKANGNTGAAHDISNASALAYDAAEEIAYSCFNAPYNGSENHYMAEYFKITGEDKQLYIDKIKEDKRQ